MAYTPLIYEASFRSQFPWGHHAGTEIIGWWIFEMLRLEVAAAGARKIRN